SSSLPVGSLRPQRANILLSSHAPSPSDVPHNIVTTLRILRVQACLHVLVFKLSTFKLAIGFFLFYFSFFIFFAFFLLYIEDPSAVCSRPSIPRSVVRKPLYT